MKRKITLKMLATKRQQKICELKHIFGTQDTHVFYESKHLQTLSKSSHVSLQEILVINSF